MQNLPFLSQAILYFLLALMAFDSAIVWLWQIMVMKGKVMKNPDGSVDDWHVQKMFYGIAIADIFLACPTTIAGIVMLLTGSRWGYYILALVSFWFLWSNIMTTVTSMRFEKPKMTLRWFFTFPFGSFIGLAYIIWTFIHFDIIYFRH
ncbi:MAG: hypothetical protein JSU64_03560 [candidate division WOR-3 bacterium]|nr:MAG: hypothetical protein JSU64_03560 [candidate division WOR-3 bacterium]